MRYGLYCGNVDEIIKFAFYSYLHLKYTFYNIHNVFIHPIFYIPSYESKLLSLLRIRTLSLTPRISSVETSEKEMPIAARDESFLTIQTNRSLLNALSPIGFFDFRDGHGFS